MSKGDIIEGIFLALFGSGGFFTVWLTLRYKRKDPLDREEVADAEAVRTLDGATEHVTAAMIAHVNAVEARLNAKLETVTEELHEVKDWQVRVRTWWKDDIVPNWHYHRKRDYPPDMPL